MHSPSLLATSYRFGRFEADVAQGILTREGTRVRLQDQSFTALALLLEHHGEVVTREELRLRIWPDGTNVEFEGSLNAILKRLRAALDDDADNPRFIETLPRRGYRFVAPVQSIDPRNGAMASATVEFPLAVPAATMPRARALRHPAALAAAVVLCALIVWQVVYWAFPLPQARVVRRTRLTTLGRLENNAPIFDGSRILFSVREGSRLVLMQTSLEGGQVQRVDTPLPNTEIFAISPDRTKFLIGSSERRVDEKSLWIWPVQGGPPRRFGNFFGGGAVWSSDGQQIVFTMGHEVALVSNDGSDEHILARVRGGAYRPVLSSDGETIRFNQFDNALNTNSTWEMRRDGTGLHALTNQPPDAAGEGWLGDKYFVYRQGEGSQSALWAVREAPSFWHRNARGAFALSAGPDDSFLGATIYARDKLIALAYWHDGELLQFSTRAQTRTGFFAEKKPADAHFSPDGRSVVFSTLNNTGLWRCGVDGNSCLKLSSADFVPIEPRWSVNGQIVFTDVRRGVMRHMYLVPASGISSPKLIGPADQLAGTADWTADGKNIVAEFGPDQPDADNSLYFLDPVSGQMTPLPDSLGRFFPACSPNGRWIAAGSESGHSIALFDMQNQKWITVLTGNYVAYPYWSHDSKSLYYQDLAADGQPVFRFDLASRRSVLVFNFDDLLRSEAVSYRLQGIGLDDSLYIRAVSGKTDLYLLDLSVP